MNALSLNMRRAMIYVVSTSFMFIFTVRFSHYTGDPSGGLQDCRKNTWQTTNDANMYHVRDGGDT